MLSVKRFFMPIMLVALLTIVTTSVFGAEGKTVAYYFHGNMRCATCHKMEEYINEALDENFKDELASGLLISKAVNTDEKENKHFVDEYELYTKTLIIARTQNGKTIQHKNLSKIWEHVGNKENFITYVTTEIADFLKDNQ